VRVCGDKTGEARGAGGRGVLAPCGTRNRATLGAASFSNPRTCGGRNALGGGLDDVGQHCLRLDGGGKEGGLGMRTEHDSGQSAVHGAGRERGWYIVAFKRERAFMWSREHMLPR
jgi:hypothetical protein